MSENYHVKPYGTLTHGQINVDDIVMVHLEIEQKSRSGRTTQKKTYDVTALVEAKGDWVPDDDSDTGEDVPEGIFYQCTVMSHGSLMGLEMKNVELKDIAGID